LEPLGASQNIPLVALTGATGFIGRYLLQELPKRGYRLRALLRRPSVISFDSGSAVIGDLARPQNVAEAFSGVDAVIHSAGIAQTTSGVPEDDYRVLNTEGTVKLARAAQRAGAKRFIFLSSIRAQTGPVAACMLSEDIPPAPTDAYGRSKLAAEEGLARIDFDWVALRLVLVYGPGVKGNMARLLRLASSALPLPLGGLAARRSLLCLDNLIEAIDRVLKEPRPLCCPLIVADRETLSVPEMIAAMRRGLGRRPGLIRVAPALLEILFSVARREDIYERLSRSLTVDISALERLNWMPQISTQDGLASLARSFAYQDRSAFD
jgi:UDP-glucose 4-epimerase